MTSDPEPLADIISLSLPEDTGCGHPVQADGCFCAVRTGGDTLAGTFTIKLHSNQRQTVDLCFQGVCRTWLPDTDIGHFTAYEHRFLLQTQCVDVRYQSTGYATTWPAVRIIPFTFQIPWTVPAETIGNISCQDQSNHGLYPSAKIGRSYFDPAHNRLFAQPFITYILSVSIRRNIPTTPFRHCISRPIKVMPTTTEPPPIDTTSFEGEYIRVARANFRNGFCGRSCGSLEFSAEEPHAIRLPDQFSQSQTTVFLRIDFQHIKTEIKLKTIPYNWKFEVCWRLQRRVFCATHPLARMPTIANASGSSKIGVHTKVLSVEKKRYERLAWRNNHTSPHGTILVSDKKAASWITTIPIKVTADSSLLPSFFCATSSLRYSILLDVRVVGSWSRHSSLVVPVQIISPARKMSQLEADGESISGTQLEDFSGGDSSAAQEPPEYRRTPF